MKDENRLTAGELARAFPVVIRQDALTASAKFQVPREFGSTFSVRVCDELVTIPCRLHFDASLVDVESLTSLEREIADCLLTRHTDGFVRQQHLRRIVGLRRKWVPPFVVQLAGEYVVEILTTIHQSLPALDSTVYREFLQNNRTFLDLTGQRIASYWNCYYRHQDRKEYVGFKILDFFRRLVRSS